MTKLEKKLKERERRAIDAVNKSADDFDEIYQGAMRVLFDLALLIVGIIIGFYLSESRVEASTTVSVPPRAEYVGVIPTEAQNASEPPQTVNETVIATMPDAVMVERVGEPAERWESLGVWLLSAYCPESCCNGKNRAWVTASGAPMVIGETVATARLPFGTKLKIRDHIYTVTDRGVPYGQVDILHESHRAANRFGLQHAEVFILR